MWRILRQPQNGIGTPYVPSKLIIYLWQGRCTSGTTSKCGGASTERCTQSFTITMAEHEHTTRKQWSNWQNMSESRRDKWQKLTWIWQSFVTLEKLLSIWISYVNFLSLWTIFYHFLVIYHVLIRTNFYQFDHCFLVVAPLCVELDDYVRVICM